MIPWKDKKLVTALSTLHDFYTDQVERWYKDNEEKKVKRKILIPKIIKNYSKFMGGVDRFDQSCFYFTYSPKTKRWTFRVFFHFLEIALHNSYIFYKKNTNIQMTYVNFRKSVMKSLAVDISKRKK